MEFQFYLLKNLQASILNDRYIWQLVQFCILMGRRLIHIRNTIIHDKISTPEIDNKNTRNTEEWKPGHQAWSTWTDHPVSLRSTSLLHTSQSAPSIKIGALASPRLIPFIKVDWYILSFYNNHMLTLIYWVTIPLFVTVLTPPKRAGILMKGIDNDIEVNHRFSRADTFSLPRRILYKRHKCHNHVMTVQDTCLHHCSSTYPQNIIRVLTHHIYLAA